MKIDNEYLLEIKEKAQAQRARLFSELQQAETVCIRLRNELHQAAGAIAMIDMFIQRLDLSDNEHLNPLKD